MTTVHHVYGAYLYDTPWRLHVMAFSIPILVFNWFVQNRRIVNGVVFYAFCIANALVTLILIGIVEGVYNQLLKNILFFAKVNTEKLVYLFPTTKYVMPNDFLFEFTVILQALIVFPLIYYFVMLFIERRKTINSK